MKRVIYFTVFLGILFLTFQFVVSFFIKDHDLSYVLVINDKKFSIKEQYQATKTNNYYQLEIKEGDKSFLFQTQSLGKRKERIVNNIEFIDNGSLYCIYPILNSASEKSDVLCNKDAQMMSYTALKDDQDVSKFISALQSKGNMHPSWTKLYQKENYDNFIIYPNNFTSKEHLMLWDYLGLKIINKDGGQTSDFLSNDHYDNTLGALVGSTYIVPNYSLNFGFNQFFAINIPNGNTETITVDETLATDTYLNGVIDGKVYFLDKRNQKQYEYHVKNKTLRLVGSLELQAQYYNGKWETRNFYDFIEEKITFNNNNIPSSLKEKYPNKTIYWSGDRYYLVDNSGNIYVLYDNHLDNPILLFQAKGISNMIFKNGYLYYIQDDTIYHYSTGTGLQPLVTNNELRYNHNNIYDVLVK